MFSLSCCIYVLIIGGVGISSLPDRKKLFTLLQQLKSQRHQILANPNFVPLPLQPPSQPSQPPSSSSLAHHPKPALSRSNEERGSAYTDRERETRERESRERETREKENRERENRERENREREANRDRHRRRIEEEEEPEQEEQEEPEQPEEEEEVADEEHEHEHEHESEQDQEEPEEEYEEEEQNGEMEEDNPGFGEGEGEAEGEGAEEVLGAAGGAGIPAASPSALKRSLRMKAMSSEFNQKIRCVNITSSFLIL